MNKSDSFDTFFTISKLIGQSSDWKPTLDEIIYLISPVINFDHLFVHQADSKEPAQTKIIYAKSQKEYEPYESQLAWEETLTNLVIATQNTILQQLSEKCEVSSSDTPFFLGIPLFENHFCQGAMVFIRYGGARFSQDDVVIAEFLAQQVALLIEFHHLRLEQHILNSQREQSLLQDNFISNITHELGNPLGCIKGFTTTMLRNDITWKREKQIEFLKIIDQETDRLQELIDNLLDSARIQSGRFDMQFAPLEIEKVVDDVVAKTQISAYLNQITTHVKRPVPLIMGDSRRLTQVFENILSNAEKHALKSDVIILIEQVYQNNVRIMIEDNGPGIDEKYIPRIFERFFRVPDQAPNIHGSGLGLYICKQIIEAHGGRITLSSRKNKGTKIEILMPGSKRVTEKGP